ncbi:MAG: DNA-3-methyladenine glycosylase I [Actinomycetota bacterium]
MADLIGAPIGADSIGAGLTVGSDGKARCWWGSGSAEYITYHDEEWGRPVTDDSRLLEKLCLEGFQAGLSWLTVLRKRPAFRRAFAAFEPAIMAGFGEEHVARLLADREIIRHAGKIRSALNNARRALLVAEEEGSLAGWVWTYADSSDRSPTDIVAATPASTRLAKDLKKRGFTFVGPTTVYAFMQAVGLVNDHLAGCWARERCQAERLSVIAAFSAGGDG